MWFKGLWKKLFAKKTPLELKAEKLLEQAMKEEAERQAEAEQRLGVRDTFIAAQEMLETPWAMFEIANFDEDGQVKVEFNWNDAFIKRLDELGFTAETEEDTVQLFFYASQMRPTTLAEVGGDESVPIEDLPTLSENVNRMVR